MSSSFEKSVKGATKPKLAPPKSKYIESILQASRAGEAGVAEVFRVLTLRLRDSSWTISFKALIVIHLMIREGQPDVTLSYLSNDPRKMVGVSTYTNVQTQGSNVNNYSQYIIERAKSFQKSKVDYVSNGRNRLKSLSVDKGLLRETEIVQSQIKALLKCDLFADEMENEITLTAFRLLTMDLLVLYQVMNEGTICVLEHYFEMSRPDAERALEIYKTFTRHTESVVQFLAVARDHQQSTRLEIPKLRHAPTSLASSLEEYLNDRDFETNRRQYIAQHQGKTSIKAPANLGASSNGSGARATQAGASFPTPKTEPTSSSSQPSKGPAPDLIDFFDSIEQNQQLMAQDSAQFQQQAIAPPFAGYPQQTGQLGQFGGTPQGQFMSQPTGNPFMHFQQQPQQPQYTQQPQIQPQFTGAGFGGYTPQPQQQQQDPQWQFSNPSTLSQNSGGLDQFGQQPFNGQPFPPIQEQPTNPFRKSMMPAQTGSPVGPTGQQGGSNPFARNISIADETPAQHFAPAYAAQPSYGPTPPPQMTQSPPPLIPQQTGTNPFARNQSPTQPSPATPSGSVMSNPTGGTNPFKNSAFMNQQTGQGWQSTPQASMGGLEQLDTIPVFPRPGQPQQQQQQYQSPWQ